MISYFSYNWLLFDAVSRENGKELLQTRAWSWYVLLFFWGGGGVLLQYDHFDCVCGKLNDVQINGLFLCPEKRRAEAVRIREKYPDRIPVRTMYLFLMSSVWIIYFLQKQCCYFVVEEPILFNLGVFSLGPVNVNLLFKFNLCLLYVVTCLFSVMIGKYT